MQYQQTAGFGSSQTYPPGSQPDQVDQPGQPGQSGYSGLQIAPAPLPLSGYYPRPLPIQPPVTWPQPGNSRDAFPSPATTQHYNAPQHDQQPSSPIDSQSSGRASGSPIDKGGRRRHHPHRLPALNAASFPQRDPPLSHSAPPPFAHHGYPPQYPGPAQGSEMYSGPHFMDRSHQRREKQPRYEIVAGRPGYPPISPHAVERSRFTEEDDLKIKHLKEETSLTWAQISDFFPGRNSGTLQVRYCNRLKERQPIIWTEDMDTTLKSTYDDIHKNFWKHVAGKFRGKVNAKLCEDRWEVLQETMRLEAESGPHDREAALHI